MMDASRATAAAGSVLSTKGGCARVAEWWVVGALGVIFLLYLGLVPLGQWQADEYDVFARLQHSVWGTFATRMQWTLRPWEALFVEYGLLVNHFQRALTGWFLGLLWAGFLFCACATAFWERREKRVAVLLTGLALAVAFLTSGPLYQLFYWPVATVVYLPVLSATLLLFVQTLWERQLGKRGRLICGACLLAAASGGELGATFVLCYAVLQGLSVAWFRARRSDAREEGHYLYWALPGLLALAVMVVASMHRLTASEGAFTVASPELHHPIASAVAAVKSFAMELVGVDADTPQKWLAFPRLLSRLLLAAGMALVGERWAGQEEAQGARNRGQMLVTGAAFLLASLAVLFGSYLHFGSSAGERLETLRRAWILMAYVAAAVAIARSGLMRRIFGARGAAVLAPTLILAGVVVPWHVSPLVRQYSTYKNMECVTARSFESGVQRGSDAMTFILPRVHGVITPLELEPGEYMRGAEGTSFNEAYAQYVLEYFGKQKLTVLPNRPCEAAVTGSPLP